MVLGGFVRDGMDSGSVVSSVRGEKLVHQRYQFAVHRYFNGI